VTVKMRIEKVRSDYYLLRVVRFNSQKAKLFCNSLSILLYVLALDLATTYSE
jgi:hypothetical protein